MKRPKIGKTARRLLLCKLRAVKVPNQEITRAVCFTGGRDAARQTWFMPATLFSIWKGGLMRGAGGGGTERFLSARVIIHTRPICLRTWAVFALKGDQLAAGFFDCRALRSHLTPRQLITTSIKIAAPHLQHVLTL